ncbi:MAG: reverse gyrase [Candidatus Baldrarchaeia archaeon]
MRALFDNGCPNCNGRISDERLLLGVPCESCLPVEIEFLKKLKESMDSLTFKLRIADMLRERGALKDYEKLVNIELELRKFEKFFEAGTGSLPWSAQREWAKRVFKGLSFAITAPTGVGKTLFGILMAAYLATKGKKSYIILPTTVLVKQVSEKLSQICEKANADIKVLAYHGALDRSSRETVIEAIREGAFDILVTTSQFLAMKFDELLSSLKFDFIFVDDVDALLKSSKNIDRVLMLLGFPQDVIEKALTLIRLKKRLNRVKNEELVKSIREEINTLSSQISSAKEQLKHGVLIISSATGKSRGDRSLLFRELLGFTMGTAEEGYRNVQDLYVHKGDKDLYEFVLSLVKRLGTGGLIFVPIDRGIEEADALANYLKEHGIKAEVVHAEKKKLDVIEMFSNGKVDILIGVATYYGLLVRGIDLPHRIRYAIFTGVPRFKFALDVTTETHPMRIYIILNELYELLDEKDREIAEKMLQNFRQYLNKLSPSQIQAAKEVLTENKEVDSPIINNFVNLCRNAVSFLNNILAKKDILEKIKKHPFIALQEADGRYFIMVPDVRTYIQASGRTSRLFAGGVTRGISVVIVDDEKLFRGLVRQLRWRYEESEWTSLSEVDLDKLLREVDKDRELVMKVRRGEISAKVKDLVKSALLVVESPTKAFTISNFFGKPSRRRIHGIPVYEVNTGDFALNVVASGGHVFDLVIGEGFHGVLTDDSFIPIYTTIKRCLNCGEQFVENYNNHCPRCGSRNIRDSYRNIEALRELASEAELVLIGTDPDTEGEKIGWDIAVLLTPYAREIKRIEFHEITKRAIREAFNNLKDINIHRVLAQMIRRIEDRWIGFELSRKLWDVGRRKWSFILRKYGKPAHSLSAGRVQTPVLGWIIERFKEFKRSVKDIYYVKLSNGVTVELTDIKGDPEEVISRLKECDLRIKVLDEKIETVNPLPPYSTDEMLRDASKFLRFGASETMELAQTLFESGLITYHRTDSHRVSDVGIRVAREFLINEVGEEFFQPRKWGEEKEGAHECIRPTRPIDATTLRRLIEEGVLRLAEALTWKHYKLYDLIFRRFMASQMRPAKVKTRKIMLEFGEFASKEILGPAEIVEHGFDIMYEIRLIPTFNEEVRVEEVTHRRAPTITLYTQGDIVKLMRERGIGRPSTYATIIQTLLERGYVRESNGFLVPTALGFAVYRYLSKNYKSFISEERTRTLERYMKEVEEGTKDYLGVIKELYREIEEFIHE